MRRSDPPRLFAHRLRSRRHREGWTQEQLAARTGLPLSVVKRLERGQRITADADLVEKLATVFGESIGALTDGTELAATGGQMALFPEQSTAPLRRAHFACALTRVDEATRERLRGDYLALSGVCRSRQVELYAPSDHADPTQHADLTPQEVYALEARQIARCDLFVLHGGAPSFGAGQELELAAAACVPIVVLLPERVAVSRMVLGCPGSVWEVRYADTSQLEARFAAALDDVLGRGRGLRPALDLGLGERVRSLRRRARLDTRQLASLVGCSHRFVRRLEEDGEAAANPSLQVLAGLARALDVSIIELVSGRALPLEAEYEAARESYRHLADQSRLVGLARAEEEQLRQTWRRAHRAALDQRQGDLLAVWEPSDWAPLVQEVLHARRGSLRRVDLDTEQRLAALDVELDERMG